MQQKNLILFIVLSLLILIGSLQLQNWLWPKPAAQQQAKDAAKDAAKAAADAGKPKPPAKRVHLPPPAHDVDPGIQLGASASKLRVILDPWGAGVRSVTLKEFDQADDLGKPVVVGGRREPMELVQAARNFLTPSNLLYHFDPNQENATRPLDTLGQIKWDVIEPKEIKPGEEVTRVVFAATVRDVRITKTFTLGAEDYHIGLEVKVELAEGKQTEGRRTEKFRYQLAGAHGLRMEGQWYTPIHRNALFLKVDRQDNDRVERTMEELRRLSVRDGGDEVTKGDNKLIRYGAVATQFFASGVVVDPQQAEGVGQDFIARARPTVEADWIHGTIESIAKDGRSFELSVTSESGGLFGGGGKKASVTIVLGNNVELPLGVGERSAVAVNYTMDPHDQMLATEVLGPGELNRLFFGDISVRLNTEEFKLEPGKPVVHKYLLYNGPVKVRQLADGERAPPELVNRYLDQLRLDTFTDYQSNSWFGDFAHFIGWTRLLIWCTNLMHGILWGIHYYLNLNYGLCIILLTLLVRSAMFPLSRKQTLAAQRMQEKMAKLKPEIEKLKEKHKNDPQAQKQAQTELMLKNGMINPFSSCWIMLLQMPIFMGLYYCLQESIHFRLAPFAWIENLAAPDMLIKWGQSIPIISSPSNFSGGLLSILYLGPFFNLLPLIAVAFMIVQQSMMMPPPTDEQAATQQKMMKYMTVFFGLMFYKVAAGLCMYFIISSVWGYCERKLLPKKQAAGGPEPPRPAHGRFTQWMLDRMHSGRDGASRTSVTAAPPPSNGPPPNINRDKRPTGKKPQRKAVPAEASNGTLHKLRAWWRQVLKEARKK